MISRGLGWRSGQGAALLFERSRDRFPVVSLDFSVTYSLRPYHGPGVDSAPSENEYQEHFLGVKAAGAWGWQPYHHPVPNVMKSGNLNFLEPSGPHRACNGTALPFAWSHRPLKLHMYIIQAFKTSCNQVCDGDVRRVGQLTAECV